MNSEDEYDALVKRVLELEMYIEKNGLTVPEQETSLSSHLISITNLIYADLNTMLMSSRSYPMSSKVWEVLCKWKNRIDNSPITHPVIRWYQKPQYWPDSIRKYIQKRASQKSSILYDKKIKESRYLDGN